MGMIGGKLALDPETGLSQTLTDFTRSLTWIMGLIQEYQIDFILHAGDVFDNHKPTMDELRVVMAFMKSCPCPIIVIPGNHDLAQSGSFASAVSPLRFVEGVVLKERPESFFFHVGTEVVQIDCLPYPSRGRLMAHLGLDRAMSPEDLNQRINDGMFQIVQNFSMTTGNDFRILLAHGSVLGASVNDQPRSLEHDIYVPLEPVSTEIDYIALGHIHQPQKISEFGHYSGSLLRQSFGEEKEQKGVKIVEIEKGRTPVVTFMENPHSRAYRTVNLQELSAIEHDAEMGVISAELRPELCRYRVKDEVTAEQLEESMRSVKTFSQVQPFVQIDLEVTREDRVRDESLSGQMNSSQAVERCLEKDGVEDPQLTICRETHLQLLTEEG